MSTKGSWRRLRHLAISMLLCTALLVAFLPSASLAEGPWRAEYFSNPSLTGQPVLVRDESAVNWDWGHGRPSDALPFDYFSARWTNYAWFDTGRYSLKAYTDDGVRVWLDGQVVMDYWYNQPATLHEQIIDVAAGYHSVRAEYYEHIGLAVAMVWWDWISGPVTTQVWRTEYYNNPYLMGTPVLVRDESDVNYDWGSAAPAPGVAADNFSVRWTGSIAFGQAGTYTFNATADDGIRVWLDGGLLIDKWQDQASTTFSTSRYVAQGIHPMIVEYYDHTESAKVRVWWQSDSATPSPTSPTSAVTPAPTSPGTTSGEVIVDDLDTGFQKGGPESSWYYRSVGYRSHTYWTYSSDTQVYNYAKWVPQLPQAGDYEVFVYIPSQRADTQSARYRINHNGQDHYYTVNQSLYFDKWVSLGSYYFADTGTEYVYLDDITGEPYASHKIGFDAVKFNLAGAVVPTATRVPTVTPTKTSAVVTGTPPPTHTPWVVTATPGQPTATSVPPTATPTATTVLPSCSITPILGFGRIWTTYDTVRSRLGCPNQLETNTWSGEQTCIGGYMFWREDLRLIYALYSNGTWQSFVDNWHEGDQEWDPAIVAPGGYYQPKRGFGKVWREQPGVRDKLSWGTIEERGINASWQGYEGGLMLWSGNLSFFVLYNDGTWSRYF
jgi:hypothetical protein